MSSGCHNITQRGDKIFLSCKDEKKALTPPIPPRYP